MSLSLTFQMAFAALLFERLLGYPRMLQNTIGHPVQWMGDLLTFVDQGIHHTVSAKTIDRAKGAFALFVLIACVLLVTVPLAWTLRSLSYGWVAEALLATPLLAQHDLRRFVLAVADGLDNDLEQARQAVSHIVGRDVGALDDSGVARAALESLAENSSDGIVAPAFWLCLFGLPGIAVYKAINTADSMIGHRSARYIDFGWAAARLDDLVNLLASRLTGLLIAAAASLTSPARGADAIHFMARDARKHASPNAGWPEAALAGALDVRLGGPRSYAGVRQDLPWMGRGRMLLNARHIRDGVRLQGRAMLLFAVAVGMGAVFSP
ncbi:MAG: adenosylcobinamide-phosphate synthase CbiB [Pseudomonadota bacterium]|nr:adenosylcobinamide-phosphate synthase CbiB [Pseudomonadota bacterium]